MFKLRKRGKYYQADYNIRGHRVRESTRTADKSLAEEVAARRYAELFRQVQVGTRPAWKWSDAVARYLTEKGGKRRTRSTVYLLRRLSPYFADGTMRLADISGVFVGGILESVAAGNSVATRNRYGQLIRAILRSAAHRWEDNEGRT